ncbi:hypothetical protein ACIBQX_00965 [Nonomuraea sp. NPDC049714]|uniref:hypothetical protein n=1 Tax=Nonomuraea sp. NPDC049714 TaxID=3364357 RepID=UPI0037988AC4
MKGSFIAAGGVLLAAAAMATTMVGTAVADDDKRASLCVLDASQDATWLRIDRHSVTAGTRDADACKGRVVFKDDDDKDDDKDDKDDEKDEKDDDGRHHHYGWQQPGWWGLDG